VFRKVKITAIICICPFLIFFVVDWLFPLPVERLSPEQSTRIFDMKEQPLRFFLGDNQQWHFKVSIDKISNDFLQSLIISEDKHFYEHFGINPFSIVRAAWGNLNSGRIISGASTISMQLARLMDPSSRTIGNKIKEAFRAVQLELKYSKEEILEYYINIAPFGRNFVGLDSASYFFFGKNASQLTISESALLISLLKSPNKHDPIKFPKIASEARQLVLKRLFDEGLINKTDYSISINRSLPVKLKAIPNKAMHFSRDIKQQFVGEGHNIYTTLNSNIQKAANRVVNLHINTLKNIGIHNVAIVVLDNTSGEIKAMVGSADFYNQKYQGQINGSLIRVSPGSTLKTFLYTSLIDRGLLLPKSYVLDIPTDFTGYRPRNHDECAKQS
jgi:penicillin-binding protein 1C